MAKYAEISDCIDPMITVSDTNLADADVYVDMALTLAGIGPDEAATITLPNDILRAIAVAYGKSLAAAENAIQDDSVLIAKAKYFRDQAEMLTKKLNRTVLGLPLPASGGYGVVEMGRA